MQTGESPIFIDFRENRSNVPKYLTKLGVNFKAADLVADYVVGQSCFVERKTVADFIASIVDGRLFRQVGFLSCNCGNPLLLLEGGGLYLHDSLPANTIRGVILWVTLTKKVPLLRTFNEYDTACTLRLLAKRYLNARYANTGQFQRGRKTISSWQTQMNILTQVPGLGRRLAMDLLAKFGSVTNIVQAEDDNLTNLTRLGRKRLKSIRQIFPKLPVDNLPAVRV